MSGAIYSLELTTVNSNNDWLTPFYSPHSLSQVKIATKAKMNRPYLNAIKNVKQDPRIAHALKVPVTELLE